MTPIAKLNIETKTNNQGSNSAGRLSAEEFNFLVRKVNEMIERFNKKVFLSTSEYQALVDGGEIDEDVEYYVFEDE